jgi:hypothetical protein
LDNTLSLLLGASSQGLQNDITLDKAQASNFGQYQINWRQQANTGAADVVWATNVNSARDSYFTALGDAQTSFDNTLSGAMGSYYNSMLETQIARSESHYTASKDRYDALESAVNDYSQSSFDSAKVASTKYLDAAIKEITDNAEKEKDAKEKEKDHYDGKAKEQEQEIDDKMAQLADADAGKGAVMANPVLTYGISGTAKDDFLNDYYGVSSARGLAQSNLLAAAAAKTANTAVANANYARDTALKNEINIAKKENETARKETDKETATEYKNAENESWNTYLNASVGANADYMKAYKQAEKTFNTAKKSADTAYETTVMPAFLTYTQQLRDLKSLFVTAVAHAGDAGFNAGTWFNNNPNTGQGDYLHVAMRTTGGRKLRHV